MSLTALLGMLYIGLQELLLLLMLLLCGGGFLAGIVVVVFLAVKAANKDK